MEEKADFFKNAQDVARLIPVGRVTSFGAIAKYLGSVKSARMVGWSMNASKNTDVPAHRVVNKIGLLSGEKHFSTPTEMQLLLEKEGVIVKNRQIQNFKELFWDPSVELEF
jgi:methylated-DNA-protein-cysteine methyltransferase-like protein|tara:strand:+ start:1408 stop:1740 length:333 start_codon:yes stop_codon:yes gene_type:complete